MEERAQRTKRGWEDRGKPMEHFDYLESSMLSNYETTDYRLNRELQTIDKYAYITWAHPELADKFRKAAWTFMEALVFLKNDRRLLTSRKKTAIKQIYKMGREYTEEFEMASDWLVDAFPNVLKNEIAIYEPKD